MESKAILEAISKLNARVTAILQIQIAQAQVLHALCTPNRVELDEQSRKILVAVAEAMECVKLGA